MTQIFLAESQPQARSAFRLLLQDLNMQVVGEADNWATTLTEVAGLQPDMILIGWDMIPSHTSLVELRAICLRTVIIVLVSHLEAIQQAARSAGADIFISQIETADRVKERLLAAARKIAVYKASLMLNTTQNIVPLKTNH